MKVSDFIFRFKTHSLMSKAGICRVRTFANMSEGTIYAVLSELDENTSGSVTNSIENIVEQLISLEKIPRNAIIIEHYSRSSFNHIDSFDIVTFDAKGRPSWTSISLQKCLQYLECSEDEFSDYRHDPQILKEIADALKGIPGIEQFEYTEDPEITERRLEIKNNQYSLADIQHKLAEEPLENEMREFIRGDMSLMAEIYASNNDEYICFSEFPVGRGRNEKGQNKKGWADFVVFTGRSRMSVYIIEIKGADIPLMKKNHYDSFRADVQEGIDQLEERVQYCRENYDTFRRFTYDVLEEVKNGHRPYRAFLGPDYKLQVDPNKDIHLTFVLIAGRTNNDLRDSKKRHRVENSSNFVVQIETWDSWLNKLKRQ